MVVVREGRGKREGEKVVRSSAEQSSAEHRVGEQESRRRRGWHDRSSIASSTIVQHYSTIVKTPAL